MYCKGDLCRTGGKDPATVEDGFHDDYSKIRSSYKGRKGNALASGADEGRDKLR